ncbi:unnamed protein product [Schistocephalus solidus]|uniref:Protoporphyrinogen oxidase n=1 Tax=Schistocephalus solidus TaxID=70667 RepID=A0A183TA15_SCHSO|nr:unnamed protein product [Schistocephalus solidus]
MALRCVVVGGGISGLSTAYMLSKLPAGLVSRISLYEASNEFGGCIKTVQYPLSGSYQDLGPHTARVSRANPLVRLIHSLDLQREVVWLPPAQRLLYAAGTTRPLRLAAFSAQPPFTRSPLGLLIRRACSRGPPSLSPETDMSVDEFLRTRFDDEFADYFGSALVRGICAADSRNISVSALLPQLVKWDASGPNILLGAAKEMLLGALGLRTTSLPPEVEIFLPKPTGLKIPWSPRVLSFRKGMQTLTRALVDHLRESPNVALRSGAKVSSVNCRNGQFELHLHEGEGSLYRQVQADSVFLCAPASTCGAVLQKAALLPAESEALALLRPSNSPSASIAVVALEFDGNLGQSPAKPHQRAFGHLVPRSESGPVLGIIYDSSVLPHLSGPDGNCTRFTVMLQPRVDWLTATTAATPFDLAEPIREELLRLAIEAVRTHLGLKVSSPERSIVGIWMHSIPNYPLGHIQNVRRIRRAIEETLHARGCGGRRTLHLVGASFDGVGVGDCVASAVRAVLSISCPNPLT